MSQPDPYGQPHPPPPVVPGGGHGGVPPAGYGPPPTGGRNAFAIVALVLGILAPCGGGLLSVIFGIIALNQIKKRGQSGRGMAIGGLAASGVWLAAIAVIIAVGIANHADRDESGEIAGGGQVSTDDLTVGDCVSELPEEDSITDVPGVPCGEPHQGEVFAIVELPQDDWPGEDTVATQAQQDCTDRLYTYSRAAYDDQSVDIYYLVPSHGTWRLGDREVICFTYYLDGLRTGSLRD